MWVYTKKRAEQDIPMLINLERYDTVSISQLGNRWFVDVKSSSDSSPLASVESQEEALSMLRDIYDGIRQGVSALDLNSPKNQKQAGDIAPETENDDCREADSPPS